MVLNPFQDQFLIQYYKLRHLERHQQVILVSIWFQCKLQCKYQFAHSTNKGCFFFACFVLLLVLNNYKISRFLLKLILSLINNTSLKLLLCSTKYSKGGSWRGGEVLGRGDRKDTGEEEQDEVLGGLNKWVQWWEAISVKLMEGVVGLMIRSLFWVRLCREYKDLYKILCKWVNRYNNKKKILKKIHKISKETVKKYKSTKSREWVENKWNTSSKMRVPLTSKVKSHYQINIWIPTGKDTASDNVNKPICSAQGLVRFAFTSRCASWWALAGDGPWPSSVCTENRCHPWCVDRPSTFSVHSELRTWPRTP